jgi:tetratricopeptide (TPR) repeat protein
MGLFGSSKQSRRVQGSIGYFGLQDWWLSAFSDDERQHILTTHQPLGSSGHSLTQGTVSYTSQTAVGLLWALAGWFTKEPDRPIAHRMFDKAEEIAQDGAAVLDVHFLYGQEIAIYYKDRHRPEYMDKAIRACRQQIALAPEAAKAFKAEYAGAPLPGHKGYEQWAIILEKQEEYQEAIELCAQAQAEGWSGDWTRRIERCAKKLARA